MSMWQLLEQAAKNASVNASGYVSSVQEKAHSLAAAVQDEASTLLHSAMGSTRTGPVDEILYEELAAYKEFSSFFSAEEHTHEITGTLDEDTEIRELHDALVPLELSYDEFWCRFFFRQQQAEKLQQQGETPPEEKREDEHRPAEKQPQREKAGSEDQEGVWLLRAARDAERRAATQWRQKARDLHHQLQETKQSNDEKEQKALKEWEQQLQALCDTYETKMAAVTMQIDEARAAGYDEGVRESQAIVESVRQKAEEDLTRLRMEICEGGVEERVMVLMKEKEELQKKLQAARERIAELEKEDAPTGGAAVAELTKEKDLWRMRALKMKKLKDLVQAELTTLRQQRDADAAATLTGSDAANSDDHSKLQARMNELQTQLANALAGAEARAREAYEKGIEAGKADAEQRSKQERDQAFQEGYKKAQAEAKSEMGVLKAELGMFRAFHESAAHCADHVGADTGDLLDDSLDDVSLADGQPLCSPTSSVSVFTDNGKNDFSISEVPKSTDDWGEW
ncbi:BSD domain [Phytophthora cactorum]|nr:BSD domain [Phytophthora cactorum]